MSSITPLRDVNNEAINAQVHPDMSIRNVQKMILPNGKFIGVSYDLWLHPTANPVRKNWIRPLGSTFDPNTIENGQDYTVKCKKVYVDGTASIRYEWVSVTLGVDKWYKTDPIEDKHK